MDAKTKAAIAYLKKELVRAAEIVAKFQADFAYNETYALEWSQNLFFAVAVRDTLSRYLKVLEEGTHNLDQVVAVATREVLIGARNPPHSTSPVHNLMETALIQVKAEFLEESKYFG